jgi:Tfp pilus assembly protein PilF
VGEKIKAKQVLDRALEQAKRQYVCRFIVATAYTELGDNEKALESLQQGFLQRST